MSYIAWIKLYTGLFDGEKLKFIEAMKNRDIIECILIKLYIQGAKTNDKGLIYFNKNTPYTNEMFSIIFNRSVSDIECSFKVLSDFQIIEIDENNFIRICNWEKYQNVEGMERTRALNRDRVRDHRARKKENSDQDEVNSDISFVRNCNVTVTEQKENKIENKNKIKIKNKSEIESKSHDSKEKRDNVQVSERKDFNQSDCMDNDNSKSLSLMPEKQKNDKAANELLEHYKKNSVKVIGLNLDVLKNCISIHGKDNAKSAIDKSLEVNKPNMKYINGILKNWKREGYPVLDNTERNYVSRDSKPLKFNNFKPREYDYDSLERALLGWDKSQ